MSAPLKEAPAYASDLNFSVFENNKHDYYVSVLFNGKPVFIPGCGESHVCTLAQFAAL